MSVLCNAQCNLPYKPMSVFSTDTTAFMIYNFKDRASCYKGKTVNQVLADLNTSKIPIKHYTYNMRKNRSTNGIVLITRIDLYIYNRKLVIDKLDTKIKNKNDKINSVTIFFETPIKYDDVRTMLVNDKSDVWSYQVKDFFSKQKIKEIEFME